MEQSFVAARGGASSYFGHANIMDKLPTWQPNAVATMPRPSELARSLRASPRQQTHCLGARPTSCADAQRPTAL